MFSSDSKEIHFCSWCYRKRSFCISIIKIRFIGSLGLAVTAGGVYVLFKRQDKYGLWIKTKNFNQIFIFPKDLTTKDFYNMAKKKNKHLIFLLSATIMGKIKIWDFDVLFGQYGNPIIGIKIKIWLSNIPPILIIPFSYHFKSSCFRLLEKEELFRNYFFKKEIYSRTI